MIKTQDAGGFQQKFDFSVFLQKILALSRNAAEVSWQEKDWGNTDEKTDTHLQETDASTLNFHNTPEWVETSITAANKQRANAKYKTNAML